MIVDLMYGTLTLPGSELKVVSLVPLKRKFDVFYTVKLILELRDRPQNTYHTYYLEYLVPM